MGGLCVDEIDTLKNKEASKVLFYQAAGIWMLAFVPTRSSLNLPFAI